MLVEQKEEIFDYIKDENLMDRRFQGTDSKINRLVVDEFCCIKNSLWIRKNLMKSMMFEKNYFGWGRSANVHLLKRRTKTNQDSLCSSWVGRRCINTQTD